MTDLELRILANCQRSPRLECLLAYKTDAAANLLRKGLIEFASGNVVFEDGPTIHRVRITERGLEMVRR